MFNLNDMTCPECTKKRGDSPLVCGRCLDYLNWCRIMTEPYADKDGVLDPDITHQQNLAAARTLQYVHELDLQELFMWARRHEAIAAQCSVLYNQGVIKERIPDVAKLEKEQEWREALEKQKKDNLPPVQKKRLSDFEKAVAGLMAVGVSRKDAEESTKAQFEKTNRSVDVDKTWKDEKVGA